MLQPEGFTSSNPNLVCHLRKALYGLKQAPRAWFSKLSLTLNQFGFQATKCDTSLFTRFTQTSTTYILVYVDDLLIIGDNPSEISHLIPNLHKIFGLKDLGDMHFFLGIEVIKPNPIWFSSIKPNTSKIFCKKLDWTWPNQCPPQ